MQLNKRIVFIILTVFASASMPGFADENDPVPANQKLSNDQEAVSGRFARFERVLSQMADILGFDDPERAELLRRAISQGKEQGISDVLDAIADDLENSQYGNAIQKQKSVTANLKSLLKLLQSEDRMSAVERERERLANLQKDVRNIIAQQRAARAKTQNSEAPSNAAPDQQKTLKKTDDVLKNVEKHDRRQNGEQNGESSDKESESSNSEFGKSKPGEKTDKNSKADKNSKPGDRNEKSGDKDKKSEKEPAGDSDSKKSGEKKDTDNKNTKSDSKSGKQPKGEESDQRQSGKPSKAESKSNSKQSQQSQNQQSPQSEGQDPAEDKREQTPGRKQMETARNLMQETLEQLKKQEREKAVAKQDQTIAELQNAADELEKMLSQLREEEKEMILATLEARFQRLLSMQTHILETTKDLASTPREKWLDTAISECRLLSQEQKQLTQECSFTTSLLREDGTSVSILVAVEDIEFDMGSVARLLQKTNVGELTLSTEQDIVDALKELIEATQREMAEMKQKQQQQQQQPSGNQKKPPLVELMQEIKVLRSLQVRLNRRTKKIHGLFGDATPEDAGELQGQLLELASRQDRLKESAAELADRMEQKR